jgi:hypothetical protein
VRIDPEDLKRHYALLSDEALLEIDAADLTDTARMCFQDEMARRKLTRTPEAPREDPEVQVEPEPADTGVVVGTFQYPGELEDARDVLEHAGIPYSIRPSRYHYELVVQPSVREPAEQTLRRQYFDPKAEADYQNHFELLNDEELLALETDGLSEAARRLLDEELALRGLESGLEGTEPTVQAGQATGAGLQLVGTFLSIEEAHLARGLLESGNIPCFLENEHAHLGGGAGGLRLTVPAGFYDQACDILETGLSS